jgi:RNA polymerase sigma-70 factor (ECF subfamily)
MQSLQNEHTIHTDFTIESMEGIFRAYYPRLCYYAYTMVNDKEIAEDMVQDVFMRLQGKLQNFEAEKALKSFLYLSVKNACLNQLKHKAVEEKHADTLNLPISEDPIALNNLIKAEVAGEVHLALMHLPKGCKNVITLSFFEGLKNEEIAQKLNVSINTVKTQKKRALQILRTKMDPRAFALLLLLNL